MLFGVLLQEPQHLSFGWQPQGIRKFFARFAKLLEYLVVAHPEMIEQSIGSHSHRAHQVVVRNTALRRPWEQSLDALDFIP